MTSFLQQLFAIPSARRAILINTKSNAEDVSSELSSLFADMQASIEEAYHDEDNDNDSVDPSSFCECFLRHQHVSQRHSRLKTVDDQGDVAAFVSDLLGSLDDATAGLFRGSLITRITTTATSTSSLVLAGEEKQPSVSVNRESDETAHVASSEASLEGHPASVATTREQRAEREEAFFYLSLAVKPGRGQLLDSLHQHFLQPTIVQASKQGDQTHTVMTTRIRTLPTHLLVHLQRFKFDVATRSRVKVGNFFSFPVSLDLAAFVEEGGGAGGGEAGGTLYELGGFIVHEGSASDGHYYSFVKSRSSLPPSIPSSPSWFELDDELVDAFDLDHLDDEAFGDDDDPEAYPSAVILVYDKVSS